MHKSEQLVVVKVEGPDNQDRYTVGHLGPYTEGWFNGTDRKALDAHIASLPPERRVIGGYEVGRDKYGDVRAWNEEEPYNPEHHLGGLIVARSAEHAYEQISAYALGKRDWHRKFIPALLAIIQYFEEEAETGGIK